MKSEGGEENDSTVCGNTVSASRSLIWAVRKLRSRIGMMLEGGPTVRNYIWAGVGCAVSKL